jgi:hypothetical protein
VLTGVITGAIPVKDAVTKMLDNISQLIETYQ